MSSKKKLGICKPDYNFKINTCTDIVESYKQILRQIKMMITDLYK